MNRSIINTELISRTYDADELVTRLYLENSAYRAQLDPAFEEEPLPLPTSEAVERDAIYHVTREYLRGRAESHGTRHLVVANEYPAPGNEYGNGFVHKRVLKYKLYGSQVDVLAFGRRLPARVYEYEGVRVLSGYANELAGLLSARDYDSISVHFLNAHMWNVLQAIMGSVPVYVYIHGYEARNWIRTADALDNGEAMSAGIARSRHLSDFWKHVTDSVPGPAGYIFVSNWWRQAVREDMDVVFPESRSRIIHNYIDTDLFTYSPKDAGQRFRILWVRSAQARNYGSDLAIKCLLELKKSPYWEKIEVRIVGDGKYFGEFEEALSGEGNVTISRGYINHQEIAALHKRYGIFLVPTRLDSQGVSRDEAMASGLVVATNDTAAVGEFVDGESGIVVKSEDYVSMAREIERVMDDPALFSALSRGAAARVRRQSAEASTVMREAQHMGLLSKGDN